MELSEIYVSETYEKSTFEHHVQAPVFRKSFFIEDELKRAEIFICATGFYDLFVNGRKITKGFLAPYISNPDHIVYYDQYDLTEHLKYGENVIGIMLGDGFQNGKTQIWDFQYNVFNSAPKLALNFEVEFSGKKFCFEAVDFVCKKGPVLFNDLRSGVFFDKRIEEKGWNDIGFTESEGWHKPIIVKRPRGVIKPCGAEPIVVTREIKPNRIFKGELAEYSPAEAVTAIGQEPAPARTGGYIYDFGENNAGIFRLKIRGERGQRIDIQCAERLADNKADYGNLIFYPDGYAQRDIYILGGENEEIFEPMFTYHGFRYLYVSGISDEQATEELLTYLVMSSDLENRGSFECSDEMANKIYEAGRRSDISNFYYFPTDCPQREKNGWTGDASASAEHMIMTIGTENSWCEWLNNIRLAQKANGQLPGIIPTGSWGYERENGPAWDSVIFNLPYYIYKYRGETKAILENAHMMMSYLEYIAKMRDAAGIIAIGIGDWVPVGRESSDFEAPLGFTDSTMVFDMCRKAEEMFKAVGYHLEASYAGVLGGEVKASIRRQYIDTEGMVVNGSCQTSQAMAIFYDIFEETEKHEAFQRLLKILHQDNNRMTCGFLGTRVLFHVLAQYGECERAYKMITDTKFPSYGYWIEKEFTTLPEHFIKFEHVYPKSENHHFLGDVVQWFMRYIAGLNIEDSNTVTIKPCFIPQISFAKAEHCLPAGKISVAWERNEERINIRVSHPDNVVCKILTDDSVTIL